MKFAAIAVAHEVDAVLVDMMLVVAVEVVDAVEVVEVVDVVLVELVEELV